MRIGLSVSGFGINAYLEARLVHQGSTIVDKIRDSAWQHNALPHWRGVATRVGIDLPRFSAKASLRVPFEHLPSTASDIVRLATSLKALGTSQCHNL
jgi:hypothetical protein